MVDALIRDVSDTARWVAVFRARESSRPDAVFRDPHAARLAGERGAQIAARMTFHDRNAWSFVARTWLFDRLVMHQIRAGADAVVNLAAGLDTRPYRLDVPPHLLWIEVDFPRLLAYKTEVLRDERPRCALERIPLDLADVTARRALFARIGASRRRVVLLSEGLLIYLTRDAVASLATDLANQQSFHWWILDLASPALLRMIQKHSGPLADAKTPLQFAPEQGPAFFEPYGWQVTRVESTLKAAARIRRLPSLTMRLFAALSSERPKGHRPWSGVCVLERSAREREAAGGN
jgi:methyltransferase (TIGR00027 family)